MRRILNSSLATAAAIALFAFGPTVASAELKPAYGPSAQGGPDKAKGAVIYNHGKSAGAETVETAQSYVDLFRADGWDVSTLHRPWSEDRVYDPSQKLIDAAQELRAKGYSRVVSVGQSYGG